MSLDIDKIDKNKIYQLFDLMKGIVLSISNAVGDIGNFFYNTLYQGENYFSNKRCTAW